MLRMSCRLVLVVTTILIGLGLDRRVAAQPAADAHASLGEGASALSAGVAWRLGSTHFGVDGEAGLGDLALASISASYHPRQRLPQRRCDPFVSAGGARIGLSTLAATVPVLGGGVGCWPTRRVGVRVDALHLVGHPFAAEVLRDRLLTQPRWGVRAGLGIRLR